MVDVPLWSRLQLADALTHLMLLFDGLPPPIISEHLFWTEPDQVILVWRSSGDGLFPFGW